MFEFLDMLGNYAERKIDRFENDHGLCVDTCAVNDSREPYETGVKHPNYNEGAWIIVEMYNSKEEAQQGHDKWVKLMTAKRLPVSLKDVATNDIADFASYLGGEQEFVNSDILATEK